MNPLNFLLHRFSIRSLLVVGASCLLIQSAQASLLFSDGFNYATPGNLGGNVNPGSGRTWSGNNNVTISGGNLTYSGLQDLGGNDLSVAWGVSGTVTNGFTDVTSGTIFYSFLLDCTTAPGGNSYLTSLNPGSSKPNGSLDALSIYMATASGAGTYKLGLRTSGASTVFTDVNNPLSVGTTYLVVAEYDFGSSLASLFLNPVAGGSMPAATLTLTPTTAPTAIANVGFKAQLTTGGFLVDNLMIGTTWGDVTPAPEPSSLALAGLGALGLAVARRMRR